MQTGVGGRQSQTAIHCMLWSTFRGGPEDTSWECSTSLNPLYVVECFRSLTRRLSANFPGLNPLYVVEYFQRKKNFAWLTKILVLIHGMSWSTFRGCWFSPQRSDQAVLIHCVSWSAFKGTTCSSRTACSVS